jgi:hypothetical protein
VILSLSHSDNTVVYSYGWSHQTPCSSIIGYESPSPSFAPLGGGLKNPCTQATHMHTHTHTHTDRHKVVDPDETSPVGDAAPLVTTPLSLPLVLPFLSQLLHHLDRTLERFDSLLHLLALVSKNGRVRVKERRGGRDRERRIGGRRIEERVVETMREGGKRGKQRSHVSE